MTNELLAQLLARIETLVHELQNLIRPGEIRTDLRPRRFAERTFQLTIEAAIDVAKLIVPGVEQFKWSGERIPNRDLFLHLLRMGLLQRQQADRLTKMVEFRNKLVHPDANWDRDEQSLQDLMEVVELGPEVLLSFVDSIRGRDRVPTRATLLQDLKEGDVRKGVVRNIADFGAFVDLGGIDGLLHITDMSWGRINHPTEVVKLEEEITVKVLKVDQVTERIALGLKQLQPNPWEHVVSKYPVNQRVKGKVVNLMPYGAFIELEPGIEGLVHISDMSWTKRIFHPSEVLLPQQEVEAVVLAIDTDKQELSLGLKQTEANPWDKVDEKYKAGMRVKGKVRNIMTYGAFIELEVGVDGLLHINDMSWTRKVVDPNEVVKKGDPLDVMVLSVDKEKKRIMLGLRQLQPNPRDG